MLVGRIGRLAASSLARCRHLEVSGRSARAFLSADAKKAASSSGSSSGSSGGVSAGSSSTPPGPKSYYDKDGKPIPSVPDATTLFKLSNPELLLDPKKRASWSVVAGVVVFFSVYLGVTAYREGLLTGEKKLAEEYAAEVTRELEVQKVLPDGRLLLRDGSIVRREAATTSPPPSPAR